MADVEQTQIKRTMLINSNIVLALIDHTKFNNNNNFVKSCDLDYLDYVITDRRISDNTILQALKKNRVNIIYKKLGSIYDKKKRSSNSWGYKKIAIASVRKLIHIMFALIKHDQLYDYNVATHNQRL